MRANVLPRGAAHLHAHFAMIEKRGELIGHSLRVTDRHDVAGFAVNDRFVGTAHRSGDDRQRRCRGFHKHTRITFEIGREREDIRVREDIGDLVARHRAVELHAGLQTFALDDCAQRAFFRPFANEHEFESINFTRPKQLHRLQQKRQIFLICETSHVKNPRGFARNASGEIDFQEMIEIRRNHPFSPRLARAGSRRQ